MKTKFNPWPLGIVMVFVIFISGMATAIVIACTHRDSLVDENYYESELKFQGQIDGAARAEKAGASVTQNPLTGRLVIQIPPGHLAQKFSGTVQLYRPSAPELDREFLLEPNADGTQSFDVSKLAAGAWTVRAKWNAGGEDYFIEQKIKI